MLYPHIARIVETDPTLERIVEAVFTIKRTQKGGENQRNWEGTPAKPWACVQMLDPQPTRSQFGTGNVIFSKTIYFQKANGDAETAALILPPESTKKLIERGS